VRIVAAVAALIGGVGSVGAFVLDRAVQDGAGDALAWVSLLFLGVAALGAGAGLVSSSATWLRVLVAVCFTLLVWSVLQVLSQGIDDRLLGAVVGVVAVVVGTVVLRRPPARTPEPAGRRPRGSHAR
jgi:hypothetical protein